MESSKLQPFYTHDEIVALYKELNDKIEVGAGIPIGYPVRYAYLAANGLELVIVTGRVVGVDMHQDPTKAVFKVDIAFDTATENIYVVRENLEVCLIDSPETMLLNKRITLAQSSKVLAIINALNAVAKLDSKPSKGKPKLSIVPKD